MPLPLIAAAWALGSLAAGGATAGGVGASKMRRAKRTVEEKAEQVGRAERLTARQRNDCEEALTVLGAAKVLALNQALQPFSQAFSRLKNVDLEVNVGEHGAPPVDEVRLREVGRLTASALDVLGGVGASAAAAAIASGSTSYAVGALATAGTGTAISSLGGAAASNAALAWLGGGTLAAGGRRYGCGRDDRLWGCRCAGARRWWSAPSGEGEGVARQGRAFLG